MICNKSDSDSVERAAKLLRAKKVLILPTDTVYGFSGIAEKTDSKIRQIKGREESKPFIILIDSPKRVFELTDDKIPESLLKLWPGPLTIIVHKKENPAQTVAVRCPGDEWLRTVIAKTGFPLNSTSVNRSGSEVLSKVCDIACEFENEVSLIVSAGDCKTSVPSTIVRIDEGKIIVVREGAAKIS